MKEINTEEINLEIGKQITFDELIQHGRDNGANIVNEMPWSWKINGLSVTHENDNCYIVETMEGLYHFKRGMGEYLMPTKFGYFSIMTSHNTHSPGGCPM